MHDFEMEQVFTDLFHQTFQTRLVKVTPKPGDNYNELEITWEAVPGAVAYNVYGSPSPFTKNLLNLTPITATNLTYVVPSAPDDIVWHFWIKWISNAQVETLIETEGATIYTNVDKFEPEHYGAAQTPQTTSYGAHALPQVMMPFYKDEIRRRHQTILNNDGEDFYLYLRKWSGDTCPKQDERVSSDPDNDSLFNCDLCFGTGILGGYWSKIMIRMRYGDMPVRRIAYKKESIEFSEDFNSWTL